MTDHCIGLECQVGCDSEADCELDEFCDNTFNYCRPKVALGEGCGSDEVCLNDNCQAGTCSECDEHDDCAADEYCTLDVIAPIDSVCTDKKPSGSACARPASSASRAAVPASCAGTVRTTATAAPTSGATR